MRVVFYSVDHDPVSNIPSAIGALMRSLALNAVAQELIGILSFWETNRKRESTWIYITAQLRVPSGYFFFFFSLLVHVQLVSVLFYGYRNQVYVVSCKVIKPGEKREVAFI